jgi:hypothetical protein
MTSTDITSANIYQFLGSMEEGQGTICEDEADDIDEDKDKMRIYKNGYTTGYPVLRTDTTYGRKQYRFHTFCFKAFAAERTPDSTKAKGFNQRIIQLTSLYGSPQYDISEVINPAGEEKYQTLFEELLQARNLLLVYRLQRFNDKIPDIRLNIQNREKQLFKPIIRIFQNTETLKQILPIISRFVSQNRELNANTLHAFLYKTIKDLIHSENKAELESNQIWDRIKVSLQGDEIPNRPQSYQSVEFGEISQKGIVQILKDVFGATKSKRHGEGRKYVFDLKKLERLGKIYDLSIDIQVDQEDENGTHGTHGTLVGLDRHVGEETSEEEIVNNFDKNKEYHKEITLQEQQGEGEGPSANASKGHQISDGGHLPSFPWIYCSTALRMNVLLGISPRALSDCFTSTMGKVIPTFSVLPANVVPIILVLYIVPQSYKSIVLQPALCLRNSEKQDQTIYQALLVSMFLLSFLSENNFSSTVTTLSIPYHSALSFDA